MKKADKKIKASPKKYSISQGSSGKKQSRVLTAGGWMRAKLRELGIVKPKTR